MRTNDKSPILFPAPRLESFQTPAVLDLVIESRPVIEKIRRGEKWEWTEEERTKALVYSVLKMAEFSYNENIRIVAKDVAQDERLQSLKSYFDVAEALRTASRSDVNPIPAQYHFASLYVVAEGFEQLGLKDSKITALCKSPHLRVLKKLRDSVFHYQANRLNNRLLAFLTEDCISWASELRSEFKRWLDDNVKRPHQLTVGQMLDLIPSLIPGPEGANIGSRFRAGIASFMKLSIQEFESRYETIKATAVSDLNFRSILGSLVEEKKDAIWPILDAFTAGARRLKNTLRPVNIDAMAQEHLNRKG